MNEFSINNYFEFLQQELTFTVLEASNGRLAYCPMCDAIHENNSNCQRMG